MNIEHLDAYIEMKKDTKGAFANMGELITYDSKRVALHNLLGQTLVVTEHEGGFYLLRSGNWELSWSNKKVDAWNKKQGLTKDQVNKIVDFSFCNDYRNEVFEEKFKRNNTRQDISYEKRKVSYKEQLEKYKTNGYVLDVVTGLWDLSKSKQKKVGNIY